MTGRVRVVSSLVRDSGRVFGFDVKATDKRGADDGKSAIANVFVSTTLSERMNEWLYETLAFDGLRTLLDLSA